MIRQNNKLFGASLGIILSTFCFSIAPALANKDNNRKSIHPEIAQKSSCIVIENLKLLRTIRGDEFNKVICRRVFHESYQRMEEEPQDELTMRLYKNDIFMHVIRIEFYPNGRKRVRIVEDLKNGMGTDFLLQGRTFDQWNGKPKPQILKEYNQEITEILNTWENNSAKETDITF